MNDVAHTDEKGIDLNDDGQVIATRYSMEEYASHDHPGRLVMLAVNSGEQFSANANDYFAVDLEEPFEHDGQEMVLAYVIPESVRPVRIVTAAVNNLEIAHKALTTALAAFQALGADVSIGTTERETHGVSALRVQGLLEWIDTVHRDEF